MGHIPEDFVMSVTEAPEILNTREAPEGYYKLALGDLMGIEPDGTFQCEDDIFDAAKYLDGTVVAITVGHDICRLALSRMNDFMFACYNALTNLGYLQITAPYYLSHGWARDPRNILRITHETMGYYYPEWCKIARVKPFAPVNFEIIGLNWVFESDWETRADGAKKFAMTHEYNVIKEIVITLKAIK